MEAASGIEPEIKVLQTSALPLGYAAEFMERKTGIEPVTKDWKSLVLPLNYFRIFYLKRKLKYCEKKDIPKRNEIFPHRDLKKLSKLVNFFVRKNLYDRFIRMREINAATKEEIRSEKKEVNIGNPFLFKWSRESDLN